MQPHKVRFDGLDACIPSIEAGTGKSQIPLHALYSAYMEFIGHALSAWQKGDSEVFVSGLGYRGKGNRRHDVDLRGAHHFSGPNWSRILLVNVAFSEMRIQKAASHGPTCGVFLSACSSAGPTVSVSLAVPMQLS